MTLKNILADIDAYFSELQTPEAVTEALNQLRSHLHTHSPFAGEPVDCVLWVKAERVVANDYNPNVMAPVEKKLLTHSLREDGFTQPVVVSQERDDYRVVDGFHRQWLGRKQADLSSRLHGYLPVACINAHRRGEAERIAATIRHNRARGRHRTESMSDIVRDLARRGWDDARISLELGMDADEVLRLKQISGLTELFGGEDYSPAWTVE